MALKSLSHGMVNERVAKPRDDDVECLRGVHSGGGVDSGDPRTKTVLNICDGIKGVFHGGPFARPQLVWEHKTMYFATDRFGWTTSVGAIDARAKVGREPLAEGPPGRFEHIHSRAADMSESPGRWDWACGAGRSGLTGVAG